LPFTTPKIVKVQVDAAYVNLQVAILIEAQTSTGGSIAVVLLDVHIDGSLDARSIKMARKGVSYDC